MRHYYRFTFTVNKDYKALTNREKLELELFSQLDESGTPLFSHIGLPTPDDCILVDRFIWVEQLPEPVEFIKWIRTQPGVVRFNSYDKCSSSGNPDIERLLVREKSGTQP